jgi:hypothetical protein
LRLAATLKKRLGRLLKVGLLSCSHCKEEKDETLFPKATGKPRGYAWVCKSCKKAKREQKQASMSPEDWYQQNRAYWLKSKYDLLPEEYDAVLREQQHKCAICGCDETEALKGLLFVDHCHKTLKIRGLLCHLCNTGIGKLKDSPGILRSAIKYLEKNL